MEVIESGSFFINYFFCFVFVLPFRIQSPREPLSLIRCLPICLRLRWLTLDTTVQRIDGRYRRQVNSSTSFLLYAAHIIFYFILLLNQTNIYPIQWQIGLHFWTSTQHPRNDKLYRFPDLDFVSRELRHKKNADREGDADNLLFILLFFLSIFFFVVGSFSVGNWSSLYSYTFRSRAAFLSHKISSFDWPATIRHFCNC